MFPLLRAEHSSEAPTQSLAENNLWRHASTLFPFFSSPSNFWSSDKNNRHSSCTFSLLLRFRYWWNALSHRLLSHAICDTVVLTFWKLCVQVVLLSAQPFTAEDDFDRKSREDESIKKEGKTLGECFYILSTSTVQSPQFQWSQETGQVSYYRKGSIRADAHQFP